MSASDTGARIYLGGPISDSDDPYGWREDTKMFWLDDDRFVFNDPLRKYNCRDMTVVHEHDDDTRGDDSVVSDLEIITEDMGLISGSDIMFVGGWSVDAHTVGTPMEIAIANYVIPMPVIVFGDGDYGDLSPWMRYHIDSYHLDLDDALGALEETVESMNIQSPPSGLLETETYSEWEEDVGHEFSAGVAESDVGW